MTTITDLSSTPRPAYDGPRSEFTFRDGVYTATLGFLAADVPNSPEAPACQVAGDRLLDAFRGYERGGYLPRWGVRGPEKVSSSVGILSKEDRRGAIHVGFEFDAPHDRRAVEFVEALVRATGAERAHVSYFEPNEHGAIGRKITTV